MLEVETCVELARAQSRGNILIGAEELAELALVAERLHGASLDELVRALAQKTLLHQRKHDRLAEKEPAGAGQVLLQFVLVDDEALHETRRAVEHERHR